MAKKVYGNRGDLMADFVLKMGTLKTEKAKLNAEEKFRKEWGAVKDLHKQMSGKVVKDVAIKTADDFIKAMKGAEKLDGVELELNGDWLIAKGNTYPNRKALYDAGFIWHGYFKYWYFQPGKPRHFSRRKVAETA